MPAMRRQDWDSLFGHLVPATAPSEAGSVSGVGASLAAMDEQVSSARDAAAPAEAQLVDLSAPHREADIDQLFQEADVDQDGR